MVQSVLAPQSLRERLDQSNCWMSHIESSTNKQITVNYRIP